MKVLTFLLKPETLALIVQLVELFEKHKAASAPSSASPSQD